MVNVLVLGRGIPHQPHRSTGQRLVEGFKQAGHFAHFYGNFYCQPSNFIGAREVYDHNWDLVVYGEMTDGWPGYENLFRHHKLKDVKRVYWDFDSSYNPETNKQYASTIPYNGYLVANRYYVDKFAAYFNKPTLHLPYACSPQWENPTIGNVQKKHLAGFIGTIKNYDLDDRARSLKFITDNLTKTESFFVQEGLYGDDLMTATNSLYVMYHRNRDNARCAGLVPCRPWEVTACGVTLLMDEISYDDFVQFLPNELHSDLLVYNSDEEIVSILNEFAQKKSELSLMGERLGNFVRENHSYKQRAIKILEWTQSIP